MNKLKRILLIDDDPIQNLINTKLLKRLEFSEEIHISVNGREALEDYISKHDAPPDIIFLDINMPIMNGWEFLDLLVNKGWEKFPKIYMLTSSISPEDIQKSEDHPMVESYFTKPLSIDKLSKLKDSIFNPDLS
ncbi:MAG: response regulator [Flavobacteriales bacterium]|nr:response regulator [Flavobacteriales bacterium]